MIFVDSNVPMYLVGAPHPNRDRAVDTVFPVTRADAGAAADIAAAPGLSARDCLHLAVMRANRVTHAFTFDQGFARHTEITVLP